MDAPAHAPPAPGPRVPIDDRGRPVHYYRMRFWPWARVDEQRLPPPEWLAAYEKSRPFRGYRVATSAAQFILLLCITGPHFFTGMWRNPWFVLVQSPIALMCMAFIFQVWRVLPYNPTKVRAALLSLGRCARCGYQIRGLAPEPDGCTVCPECSAAWRLPAPAEQKNSPDVVAGAVEES